MKVGEGGMNLGGGGGVKMNRSSICCICLKINKVYIYKRKPAGENEGEN